MAERASPANAAQVVGAILAGGRASRLGGGDKALLEIGGRTMLDRVIERLRPQVATMLINANGDAARFARFCLPVVADTIADYAGPLAGVLAAMEWTQAHAPEARFVATAAADTPFFPTDLVERMLELTSGNERMVIAASDTGTHPVFGLWPVALASALRSDLDAGQRKMHDWTAARGALIAHFPNAVAGGKTVDPFFNINEPKDLARAEALVSR